jgi:thiaminase/transcriptional activator TenA
MTDAVLASEALRAESDAIWTRLHRHPFITELAEGTLPLEKFRYFLEQDVFYLEEYARCLAMGAAKSRTAEELRYFAADLANVLDAEIPNNLVLLDKVIAHGADDRGGTHAMAPANVAYTGYMHSLAMRGGPLDIMAALLPCAWSYVEIATSLRDRTDETHPIYSEWISYFSLEETIAVVSNMRRDFDRLAQEEATTDGRRREIANAFAMSSRLELGFWEMAYTFERWPDEDRVDRQAVQR